MYLETKAMSAEAKSRKPFRNASSSAVPPSVPDSFLFMALTHPSTISFSSTPVRVEETRPVPPAPLARHAHKQDSAEGGMCLGPGEGGQFGG